MRGRRLRSAPFLLIAWRGWLLPSELPNARHRNAPPRLKIARMPSPLHATIEEFAAEGYTHVECFCPRCRVIRLKPMSWLPKISMGLTLDALARRLRCADWGGPLQSVKPWRLADVLGKPIGRRG